MQNIPSIAELSAMAPSFEFTKSVVSEEVVQNNNANQEFTWVANPFSAIRTLILDEGVSFKDLPEGASFNASVGISDIRWAITREIQTDEDGNEVTMFVLNDMGESFFKMFTYLQVTAPEVTMDEIFTNENFANFLKSWDILEAANILPVNDQADDAEGILGLRFGITEEEFFTEGGLNGVVNYADSIVVGLQAAIITIAQGISK